MKSQKKQTNLPVSSARTQSRPSHPSKEVMHGRHMSLLIPQQVCRIHLGLHIMINIALNKNSQYSRTKSNECNFTPPNLTQNWVILPTHPSIRRCVKISAIFSFSFLASFPFNLSYVMNNSEIRYADVIRVKGGRGRNMGIKTSKC